MFSAAISVAMDCCKKSSNSNDEGLLTFLGEDTCGLVGLFCLCGVPRVGDIGGCVDLTGDGGRGSFAAVRGDRGGTNVGPLGLFVGEGGIGMGAFAIFTVSRPDPIAFSPVFG